ncbi:MAG TPA: protein-L-isoaspartate(D-aspartate) O-methyltransferase [Firmicutes bacterium]|jgi:protein-L-isoaspartate(D-aspartate) O-methyltransferase|nr:protein-L-isoaspartate(D-aspartate) O-methyltransferase [Bacillota bacterium]
MDESRYSLLRQQMISEQLEPRGIDNLQLLSAFRKVPRHLFVTEEKRHLAYNDYPLSIGEKQTISQPYIVALMTQSLQPQRHEKVLEIGTGSGYQAAILAELVKHVYTVERIERLSLRAKRVLDELGYNNISYKSGDGAAGWPEKGPFDSIVVTAAADKIPTMLLEQLLPEGRMVIPVGNPFLQDLLLITKEKEGTGIQQQKLCGCRFVPLISSN